MIEKMIADSKKYLPLKIFEIAWDGTLFQMYGQSWNFTTLSSWRICENNKMIFGCYDKNSENLISKLKNLEIIAIDVQNSLLKIDPIFIFSNNQYLEIFSTDTFEPWSFQIEQLGVYIATPNEPSAFYL